MVSEKFMVNSDTGRMKAANYVSDAFASQAHLSHRDSMRLTLLTEETLGMVRAMVDDFFGQLWFEGDEKGCEIHFEAVANMDSDKKHELLTVSRTGINAAARGFMGKMGEFISNALYSFGRVIDAYGQDTIQYGIISTPGIETPNVYDMTPVWTLQHYRESLEENHTENPQAGEAWDELEKSIVANLADDVIVGVKGDRIELVIVKKFNK